MTVNSKMEEMLSILEKGMGTTEATQKILDILDISKDLPLCVTQSYGAKEGATDPEVSLKIQEPWSLGECLREYRETLSDIKGDYTAEGLIKAVKSRIPPSATRTRIIYLLTAVDDFAESLHSTLSDEGEVYVSGFTNPEMATSAIRRIEEIVG